MKIIYLCNEYPPSPHGGIGTATQMLARSMAERGHDVSVVGIYQDVEAPCRAQDEAVHVIRLPHSRAKRLRFWMNARRLTSVLRELCADDSLSIIEGYEASFAFLDRSVSGVNIIRMHGGHHFFSSQLSRRLHPWKAWQEKRSFARANHLCAVSEFVAQSTRNLLNLDTHVVEILPNFVNTSLFKPRPDIREEDGLIVFAGTITEKKGVVQLIEAMPSIVRAYPKARLLMIGRDSIDPQTGSSYINALRQQIEPGIQDHILFMDPVPHGYLPEQLARAKVCVYPSHMEAQGLVVIESMAMGKVVVASQTGPGPELIEHGTSGFLCDPHDPTNIAQNILAALLEPSISSRIGYAARRRAEMLFSSDVLIDRNEQFYQRCIEQARSNLLVNVPYISNREHHR